MIAVIDSGDLFTHNLAHLAGALGATPVVVRARDAARLEDLSPRGVVIASGTGRPEGAPEVMAVVERWVGRAPLLGVGLGMHCVAVRFGARLAPARAPVHGKTCAVLHDGTGLFAGVPSPFSATRYDSFVVDRASLPDGLAVTAEAADTGDVMALQHGSLPVFGVQFHPESAFTEHGARVMENFLAAAGAAGTWRRAM